MRMTCKKCNGRIFIDRMFDKENQLEIACIQCGKRWLLDPSKNKFARSLAKIDKEYRHSVVI